MKITTIKLTGTFPELTVYRMGISHWFNLRKRTMEVFRYPDSDTYYRSKTGKQIPHRHVEQYIRRHAVLEAKKAAYKRSIEQLFKED